MLVGREHELNALNAHYNEMLSGKGSILFLTGEAGLGKTTLVHEWQKTITSPALFAEADCSIPIGNVDVGAMEALQPWADVIARLQTVANNFDLTKIIEDSSPAWKWALMDDDVTKHKEPSGNPNASNQQQLFQQYVNLLSGISAETPLVIFLDDVHWADASSISLLFYISRQITDKRILVVATYRPEEITTVNDAAGHPLINAKKEILRYNNGKELSLNYFTNEVINEFLVKTFPSYATDQNFEQWLQNISSGNALFVSQFIKTLYEDGQLDEYGKFTGSYETITIPDSTLAVVMQRLRRLEDATRELLGYATAEGE
ncbi:MAG TPA: AAA family ATPase, partial [Candidatus Kapabacteria bacterium]|nr:AAA family ATPase [Candidatus Kapabacteria bacterium]